MARGLLARRLLVAGVVVWVARSAVAASDAKPEPIELPDDVPEAAIAPAAPKRAFRKRFATSLVFAMLFFAGAAFTAGAGNELAPDVTSTDVTPAFVDEATVPPPAPDVVTDAAPAETAPAPAPVDEAPAPVDPAPVQAADPSDAIVVRPSPSAGSPAPVTAAPAPVVRAKRHTAHAHHVAAVVATPVHVAIGPIPYQAIAFNPQAWLHANAASQTGASAIAIAQHYVGVPYVWGGAVPLTGFDCSGFTQFVYAQLGVKLPHYAASQFAAFPKLDPAQLEPGDLVFFEPKFDGPGHVALYLGNDQMIEAPHTGALVRVSSFSGAAATMGFLGAVRPYTLVAQAASVSQRSSMFIRLD